MSKAFKFFGQIIRNKFFLATLFFVIWMAFFDPKDWGNIASKKNELNQLQETETTLKQNIQTTRKELNALTSSAESIERYARENYMMKRDNEDIFLVK